MNKVEVWKAIEILAKAMNDPENRPPQWNDKDAANAIIDRLILILEESGWRVHIEFFRPKASGS